jgi:protein-disulfide isomerase
MKPDTLSLALKDQGSAARVKENSEAAFQARVTGTPTFFIGNQRVVGAQPYPQILAAAKRALGLAPKSTEDFPVV